MKVIQQAARLFILLDGRPCTSCTLTVCRPPPILCSLVGAGAKILGVTVEQALEAYGVYFVQYTASQARGRGVRGALRARHRRQEGGERMGCTSCTIDYSDSLGNASPSSNPYTPCPSTLMAGLHQAAQDAGLQRRRVPLQPQLTAPAPGAQLPRHEGTRLQM